MQNDKGSRIHLILETTKDSLGLALSPQLIENTPLRITRSIEGTLVTNQHSFHIPHDTVSKEHAVIEFENEVLRIRDLESTNGTYVNGFRIEQFPIKIGDQLQFGSISFTLQNPQEARGTTAPSKNAFTRVAKVEHSKRSHQTLNRAPEIDLSCRARFLARKTTKDLRFSAIRLAGFEAKLRDLTEYANIRAEMAVSQAVSQHVSPSVHTFRESSGDDLIIVAIGESESDINTFTHRLSDKLNNVIAERSLGTTTSVGFSSADAESATRQAFQAKHRRKSDPAALNHHFDDHFSWLHLSDLHFGAGSAAWQLDHEQVAASLVRDIRNLKKPIHRVFVTGDIAFSAQDQQYREAREFLVRVADALSLPVSAIRVVPGNHDVDRNVANKPVLKALHQYARSSSANLDELLADQSCRKALLDKLSCFVKFTSTLETHSINLDWHEAIKIGNDDIEIWGICSVWSSDSNDGRNQQGAFIANLPIGRIQYKDVTKQIDLKKLNILLTHHPLEWIQGQHANWIRSAFSALPCIHLSGHIHEHGSGAIVSLGKKRKNLVSVGGACHSDESSNPIHSFSICSLARGDSGEWIFKWNPRRYSAHDDEFRSDSSNFELDAEGFASYSFSSLQGS